MPESVTDRPSSAVEYVFLLAKSDRYFWDAEAVRVDAAQPTGQPRLTGQHKADAGGFQRNGKDGSTLGTNQGAAARNRRNSDWFMESWQGLYDEGDGPLALVVNPTPYRAAHFATFPEGLVEPFVKAGTSQHGCCPQCGAPWRRLVEKDRKPTRPGKATKVSARAADAPTNGTSGEYSPDGRAQFRSSEEVGNRDPQRHCTETRTTGWQPTCRCQAVEPVPCLTIDPFGGSGTTAAVAVRLGRRGLCCDLSADYCALARDRIGTADEAVAAPLFDPPAPVQAGLFPDP